MSMESAVGDNYLSVPLEWRQLRHMALANVDLCAVNQGKPGQKPPRVKGTACHSVFRYCRSSLVIHSTNRLARGAPVTKIEILTSPEVRACRNTI